MRRRTSIINRCDFCKRRAKLNMQYCDDCENFGVRFRPIWIEPEMLIRRP